MDAIRSKQTYIWDSKGCRVVNDSPARRKGLIGWTVSPAPVPYSAAMAVMEARAAAISAGAADQLAWLLEHPPLYTQGVSAKREDLLTPDRFPVFQTRRGGQFTYHGPGQRVAYLMLDLGARGNDVRAFVRDLERWLIDALSTFNVRAEAREDRIGLWVTRKGPGWAREDKIAAIGVRVRRGVTTHGISLNVDPDLSHFEGIVPCGIREHGVTSLLDLGHVVSMSEVDHALRLSFHKVFGQTFDAVCPLEDAAIDAKGDLI